MTKTTYLKKNGRLKKITKKLKKSNKTKKNRRNKKGGSGKAPAQYMSPDLDRTKEHDAARDRFFKKLTYNHEEYQFIFINLINSLKKRLNEMKKTPKPEEDAVVKQILTKFIIFFSDPDVVASDFVVGMLLDSVPKYKLVIYKLSRDNSFFPYCKEFINENINKHMNYKLCLTSSYLSVIYDNIDDQNICIYLTYILYKTVQKVLPVEAVTLVTGISFFDLTTPIEVAIETEKLRLVGVLMYIMDRNRDAFTHGYYKGNDYYPYVLSKSSSSLLDSITHNFLARSNPIKHYCMMDNKKHTEDFCITYVGSLAMDYRDKVYHLINQTNVAVEEKIKNNNIVPIYFKNFGDYVDSLDRKIKPSDKKDFWDFYYKAFYDVYERDPELLDIDIVSSEQPQDDSDLISAFDTVSTPLSAKSNQSSKNKSTKKSKIKPIATIASILPDEATSDVKKESIEDLPQIEDIKENTKEDEMPQSQEQLPQEQLQQEQLPQEQPLESAPEQMTEPPQPPELNIAFFSNEELKFFKHTINSLMINSLSVDSICRKIKDNIVNYSIKQTLNTSNSKVNFTQEELKEYNIMSCAIFIIIGLISHKLNETGDYQLIIKGGKGLQLSFIDYLKYNFESEDIDALLVNKKNIDDYDNKVKIATYIGELIKWIIENSSFKNISFKNPRENVNKNVGKISYINGETKVAILDIDIKFPVDNIEEKLKIGDYEYTKLHENGFPLGLNFYDFQHGQIDEKTFPIQELIVTFFYQKIDTALQEKIYLYTKYFVLIKIQRDVINQRYKVMYINITLL